jgi:hypothetical protein
LARVNDPAANTAANAETANRILGISNLR